MASFDFVDASARGYEFVWKERSYILRSVVPFVIVKAICLVAIYLLNSRNSFLLIGLIDIPAHIIEAMLVVGITRYIIHGEPIYSYVKVNKAESSPANISYKAGVAMYLLIKLVQLVIAGSLLDYSQTLEGGSPAPPPDPTIASFFLVIMMVYLVLWAFRINWLYVPVAMGFSFVNFLKMVKGINISLSMFATWFICYLPLIVLFSGLFRVNELVFVDDSTIGIFVHDIIRISGEVTLIIVQSAAMTYGFREILMNRKKKK